MMSQPVKLPDDLVLEARMTATISDRSIAGQIEHWAHLGKAIEPLLRGAEVLALKQSGRERSLSRAIAEVDSDGGRTRVRDYLDQRPFPHFEASQTPGVIVKIDEDGKRTEGRFVNRAFVALDSSEPR